MKFVVLLVAFQAIVFAFAKPTKYPTHKTAPTPPTNMPTMSPTPPTMAPTFNPADAIGTGKLFMAQPIINATFAAALTFMPDGHRILYVESYLGLIKIYDEISQEYSVVYQVPDLLGGSNPNNACLGITVHPDYPTSPYIYVYCTRNEVSDILQLELDETETVIDSTTILTAAPAGQADGGPLAFGPDGKLYLTIGQGVSAENSQNLTADNLFGKYLRMNDDGSVPSDNPWPNSVNYFYGVRNSFGFDWDTTGDLWFTDNGPSCNDEVNLAKAGGNYGWGPKSHCPDTNASGKKIIKPKYDYKKARGTVGGEFDSEGRFLVGSFDLGTIDALTLNKKRDGIQSAVLGAYVIPPEVGNLLQIETSPVTMNTYFSTIGGIFRLGPKPTA